MKKLIFAVLCVNAFLLAGRLWQELPVVSGVGAPVATENGDVNGSGIVGLEDAIHGEPGW